MLGKSQEFEFKVKPEDSHLLSLGNSRDSELMRRENSPKLIRAKRAFKTTN